MKLVVYTLMMPTYCSRLKPDDVTDHWEAHDTLEKATARYEALIERDDIYIASICSIVRSTDYDSEELT
jgi:hypothetical protein